MDKISNGSRIVIKIGSSTLTHDTGRLNLRRIETLVKTLSDIVNSGSQIVLVSSGAVSAGVARLGLEPGKRSVMEKCAIAAVGQTELMHLYEDLFSTYGHNVGQILMTKDVIDIPHRFEMAKQTFNTLISMNCIPIVNENDPISTLEMQFGGNDTLSAYVAIVCQADLIINMSDINGLYDSDPRKNPDAKLIDRVDEINDTIFSYAGGAGTNRGTGGMITKLEAAKIAADAGIPMLILNGKDPACLYDIMDGKHLGTYFAAKKRI